MLHTQQLQTTLFIQHNMLLRQMNITSASDLFHSFLYIAEVPGAGANSMMSVLTEKAVVKREELWDVVGTDKWEINNSLDEKYKPLPVHVIVNEARKRVGRELPYCVFRGNCEHFANELRYGKAESRQVGQLVNYLFFLFSSRRIDQCHTNHHIVQIKHIIQTITESNLESN